MKTKLKAAKSSLFLYIPALIVFLIGAASLVISIVTYNSMVTSYLAQGYPIDVITSQLFPQKLLPELFTAVGQYWGVAFVLFGLGKVHQKLSPAPVKELPALEAEEASDLAAEPAE